MTNHFRGKVGEKRVARHRYCITRSNGALVKAGDWESVVSEGAKVVMSMLVTRLWNEELSKTCPKCGKTRLGIYKDRGWLIW